MYWSIDHKSEWDFMVGRVEDALLLDLKEIHGISQWSLQAAATDRMNLVTVAVEGGGSPTITMRILLEAAA